MAGWASSGGRDNGDRSQGVDGYAHIWYCGHDEPNKEDKTNMKNLDGPTLLVAGMLAIAILEVGLILCGY